MSYHLQQLYLFLSSRHTGEKTPANLSQIWSGDSSDQSKLAARTAEVSQAKSTPLFFIFRQTVPLLALFASSECSIKTTTSVAKNKQISLGEKAQAGCSNPPSDQ